MPPVRGRSRRRGEVSPRRDFSPRRRRVIRSRNRDRFRDRERDIDRRNRERDIDRLGREERRANDLKQSAYNLAAKNTQRQKDRLRSQTEAFNKYLEKQRDKFNQAQGPKVQPPAKRRKRRDTTSTTPEIGGRRQFTSTGYYGPADKFYTYGTGPSPNFTRDNFSKQQGTVTPKKQTREEQQRRADPPPRRIGKSGGKEWRAWKKRQELMKAAKKQKTVVGKMPERVPRAPAGWKRDPKTGKLIQGGGRKPRRKEPHVTRATAVPNPQPTKAIDEIVPYTPKQKTYGRAIGLTPKTPHTLVGGKSHPKITEGERPTAAPATPRTTRKAIPKWRQRAVTTKLANKGGLMKSTHNDMRKGGLFYK